MATCGDCHSSCKQLRKGLCERCYERTRVCVCESCGIRKTKSSVRRCIVCRGKKGEDLARGKKYRIGLKFKIFESLGGPRCWCCGENNSFNLTVDHVLSNGAEQRSKFGGNGRCGSLPVYRQILSEGCPRDKYRVACWTCNSGRAHSPNGECHTEEQREALRKVLR